MELLLGRKLIGFIWIFNVTFKNISVLLVEKRKNVTSNLKHNINIKFHHIK